MYDLIEAFQIFAKYILDDYFKIHPTSCIHDLLIVHGIKKEQVSDTDIKRLLELSFSYSEQYSGWISNRFGSC